MDNNTHVEGLAERAMNEIADFLHEANELKSALKLIPDETAQAMARAELTRLKSHLRLYMALIWFLSLHPNHDEKIILDHYQKALVVGETIIDAVSALLQNRTR